MSRPRHAAALREPCRLSGTLVLVVVLAVVARAVIYNRLVHLRQPPGFRQRGFFDLGEEGRDEAQAPPAVSFSSAG